MEFVEDIIDKKYSVSTKSNYNRRQNRFRKWLEIFHKEDCFIEDIIDFSTIAANILHKSRTGSAAVPFTIDAFRKHC